MNSLLSNTLFVTITSALLVALFVYVNANKWVEKLKQKSLGSREEIIRLLDLMFVEVDKKKITLFMLLSSFGLGIVGMFLVWPEFWLGLVIAIVITIVGWTLPLTIVKSMYDKRCSTLVAQMVDGLTIMANGIKAGLSVTQAMERVVDNMGNPIAQEFNLILSQIRLGRSIEEALVEFGERVPKPDIQMFVTAVNILKETGGNLAETFTTIVLTIRERQKIEKKIEAMTAQGMTQGFIISMVPIILLIVFQFIDPGFVKPMYNHPLGLFILFIIFGLIIIGGIIIRKIVKIKV